MKRDLCLVVITIVRFSTGGALIAVVVSANAALADITGPSRVVDGDTLHVQGVKIRLVDIYAPERRQTCWGASVMFLYGPRATAVLGAIVGGQEVRCVEKSRGR